MSAPLSASVIIRAQDSAGDLRALLPLLRRQTVAAELIVVDSGSHDDSRAVATELADQLVTLAPGTYSPGRSLNLGIASVGGAITFALSSHCRPPDDMWIERSLALYARPDVAATNGSPNGPDGRAFAATFYQDAEHARAHPQWGFSNHASSWRTEISRERPFDESVVTAEDRLWAIEVTAAGWVIAFDPNLWVDTPHRWSMGTRNFFHRERHELAVIGSNVALPPYPAEKMFADWWGRIPEDRHSPWFHRFVNYRRAAGLLGKYLGHRDARRIRR